jgi:tetratricopeptide (TPR) repeat protein
MGEFMYRMFLALAALVASVAASAEPVWQAAETKHFVIYSKSSNQRIEELATDLEKYDKLLRMATAIDEEVKPVRVRIYEVDDMSDVQKALGMDYTTGIGGFYTSNSLGPFLVTPRKTGLEAEHFTPEIVRHHEYSHHFMLQYFPATYPGWYVEGFAELIGSSKVMDDGRIGYGMPARTRGNDIAVDWVPLQELMTNESVKYLDTYGQGWALTHFLTFDKERSAQFRQYLAQLTAGKSFAEAAKVFGDLNELDREARRYVTAGTFTYRPVKVEIQKPVITSMRQLSAGEAALVPQVISYDDDDLDAIKKTGVRQHELARRERNLQRIRQVVAQYPGDPFALHFLAEAEYASGNYAQSEAAADRLLAIRPNDVDGLARKSLAMSMGLATLSAGKASAAAAARALAVKANQLDHDNPLPLLAYYQSFHEAGEKAPKLATEGLMQAVSTLPANTSARELLVDELASEHRWNEAMAWLAPIANDPHDSPLRDSARDKMDWLKKQLAADPKAKQAEQAAN